LRRAGCSGKKREELGVLRAPVWLLTVVALTSCSTASQSLVPLPSSTGHPRLPTPIEHVVIILQENRTPDDLFQGVPGADIATHAVDSKGNVVPLRPVSLAAPYGLQHSHVAFLRDYDRGKMDGFDKGLPSQRYLHPFGYAPRMEVQPYYDMATQYVFADRMFQTNQGPSFPAHQYIVSGTAAALPVTPDSASSNTFTARGPERGGCDSPKSLRVTTIDLHDGAAGPHVFPCFDRPTLGDLLDAHGISWRYYQHGRGPGLWHAYNAIRHVRYGPDYVDVVSPAQTILSDISLGKLPDVSWVMPAGPGYSDHPNSKSAKGPAWVAAVVNAIGGSQYWNSTAIVLAWDDWGGWYDHVPPRIYNSAELGFRVPLVIISPYAKKGYVSHARHEFGSILHFTEKAFGLGSLNTTDRRADDLKDAFDFRGPPRSFVPIKAPPFNPGASPYDMRDAEDEE
jgi:phospholipase C